MLTIVVDLLVQITIIADFVWYRPTTDNYMEEEFGPQIGMLSVVLVFVAGVLGKTTVVIFSGHVCRFWKPQEKARRWSRNHRRCRALGKLDEATANSHTRRRCQSGGGIAQQQNSTVQFR
jgi:hypothetical protein